MAPEVVQRLLEINKQVEGLLEDYDNRLPAELRMNIRMRNNEKRLNDICFVFTVKWFVFTVKSFKP